MEYFHALDGIFSDGGFAAEHDGIGLLEDGVRHVGDFRARGHGSGDHRLEHVRRDDDGFAEADAVLDDAALDDRQIFHRAFDAEVAARDHDGVGLFDDFVEVFDGELILDLRDDARGAGMFVQHAAKLGDVARLAAKTERHHVHAELRAECDIGEILFGERREVDLHTGQVDVAARSHHTCGEEFAADFAAGFFQHLHVDHAVVHEHGVADGNVVDESVVIHADGVEFLALRAAHGEFKNVADLEIELRRQIAGANGGALRVHEDADHGVELHRDGADAGHDLPHPVVRRVAHVQPENVCARLDHLAQHFLGFSRRPERADDLCFFHAKEQMRTGAKINEKKCAV